MGEGLFLGLDIGASNIRIGIGDEENLYSDSTRQVRTRDYWSEEGIKDLIIESLEEYNSSLDEIKAIGIGVPGLVDTKNKEMKNSFALEELNFQNIEDETDTELNIENDANTAVMGEKHYGSGPDYQNIATIIIGSGIGGGIYYDGKLLGSQEDGDSPEPGGIIIEDDRTWDGILGGENIPNYTEKLMEDEETELPDKPSAEELFTIAEEDETAQKYVERLSELNARGIASIVNLYAPELITFSGSIAVKNPDFMQASFEKVEDYTIASVPEMKISDLGNELGLYGALAVAQNPESK